MYESSKNRFMHVIRVITIVGAALFSFDAHAWMGDWAPAFKCLSANVEDLSETSVSNFVNAVDPAYAWEALSYCKGCKLDLNRDGTKDLVYILPRMGCGLASQIYDVYFRVSAGVKHEWVDTIITGYGVEENDFVKVGEKIYFRYSDFFSWFEKSKHNHWVYQVFSFDKKGAMVCSNRDFGELFPAVTIYYEKPKFRQIRLTKNDRKKIEVETRRMIRTMAEDAIVDKEGEAKVVINSAAKKKEANEWKLARELTKAECAKLMRIMAKRFGEPGKCRTGESAFEYVWRFEGDEWLTVGVTTIDDTGREVVGIHDWKWKKLLSISEGRIARLGKLYEGEPKDCELLYERGGIALFAGETAEDVVQNGRSRCCRNSLFARLRMKDGTESWRLVLTSGFGRGWKYDGGIDIWRRNMADDVSMIFCVRRACLSMDGRTIWLVCNPHTDMYNVVCCFDLEEKTFKVLIDGNEVEEQADGTILVKGKKVYLQDENSEPDGAAWCDVWITPDGKVVKKTKPVRLGVVE